MRPCLQLAYSKRGLKSWFREGVPAAVFVAFSLLDRYKDDLTVAEYNSLKSWGVYTTMCFANMTPQLVRLYRKLFKLILGDRAIVWFDSRR